MGNSFKFKNYTKLTYEEKILILKWRNSDRVRTKMLTQDILSEKNHLDFIDTLKNRKDRLYYLFYVNDNPVGTCNFVDIDYENKEATFGAYIGEKKYNGYGLLMMYLCYLYLFETLKFEKINISVLKNNQRVYEMHKNMFYANFLKEDDLEYYLYFDITSWKNIKRNLSYNLKAMFLLQDVSWI